MRQPGLIVAAPASASGKTTVTLAALRSLARRGVAVGAAKVGPDYIDPAFHAVACGRACINLDPWAMRRQTIAGLTATLSKETTLTIVEGVMGLFDGTGVPPRLDAGSTADLAALMQWPVVLVMDARGQAATAGAVLAGLARHRADAAVAGVIFNRTGGPRHQATLRAAAAAAVPEIEVLGCLPRLDELSLPERHLGLVLAAEHPTLTAYLDGAADLLDAHVDVAAFERLARPAGPLAAAPAGPQLPPLGQRIAVARDRAFAFVYDSVLAGWRGAGAEVSLFSPLADEPPPANTDAVYLPGGYPELHAGRLAANDTFLGRLRAAAPGAAIYGECGGYMVLGEGLIDAGGTRHAMAGLLPLETTFADRRLHLGYRQVTVATNGALGHAGSRYRGHEFHYARALREGPAEPLFHCADAGGDSRGATGLVVGRVAGSFVHLIDRAAS